MCSFRFCSGCSFPASEKEMRSQLVTPETFWEVLCCQVWMVNWSKAKCRLIWTQDMSEQDHSHKSNALLPKWHCCSSSHSTQYPSYQSSQVIWSNYPPAGEKQNVPEVWDFIGFCASHDMTLSLLNVTVKHRCQRYMSLIAASFSQTYRDPKWVHHYHYFNGCWFPLKQISCSVIQCSDEAGGNASQWRRPSV